MRMWLEYSGDICACVVEEHGYRTEFRGSKGYGTILYDGSRLFDLLDSLSGPLVSGLMAGNVMSPWIGLDPSLCYLALRWLDDYDNERIRLVHSILDASHKSK